MSPSEATPLVNSSLEEGKGTRNSFSSSFSERWFRKEKKFLVDRLSLLSTLYLRCTLAFAALLAFTVGCFSFWLEEWSVVDSLYFGIVSITTVGYGDITPSSVPGQAAAMLLTVFGICIALDILNKSIEHHFSRRRWWKVWLVSAVIVISTAAMAYVEGWSAFTAVYYFVVTGTTLGYGDITPQSQSMRIFCIFYIPALVMSFALIVLNWLTNKCTEGLDKDTLIENWINDNYLGPEGFKKMDYNGNGELDRNEFLVGMVKYCNDVFGKLPDRFLVEKLESKFEEIAKIAEIDYKTICLEDVEKYKEYIDEKSATLKKKEEEEAEIKMDEISLDTFFTEMLMHFDKIPVSDRDPKAVYSVLVEMHQKERPTSSIKESILIDELKKELKRNKEIGHELVMT
eukprot:CAMPEP_0197446662 /NCGR_PEP_ID=MMETSP1175-20131217/11555_1 /TAXON_ID=1003142 /ORGANISM="Triceratium dubium, Strain CCMP147" /LENGTH=399 /DNA_ID=CAMNT_0042977809 /DNA_START=120 /DNA_END=1319 /DNA_ORIENTATION=-